MTAFGTSCSTERFVVTPTPTFRHQRVCWGCGTGPGRGRAGRRVVVSPLDVYLPTDDILEPDVLVIDDAAIVDDKVQGGLPLLVVEMLSPSSRRRDVGDKLTAYRDAGVPTYWVVDPINPRLRAWEACVTASTSRSPTSRATRNGPPRPRTL